jgi:hypothetical protein
MIKYNIIKLLNIFNNDINIIAKIIPEEIFKLEIVAALFLSKNSHTNIEEKI